MEARTSGDEPSARAGFPRSRRLTRRAELDAVTRGGKRVRTAHLEVRAIASLLGHPRIGFIVPKHKQTGVARNRLKRRLREIARTRLLPTLPSADVVVRARPEAYRASFDELRHELERAAVQVGRALA
ncbi:MAG TPA: ribonuclease P protein component [Gemmatimonadaceae bacterium]